MYMTVIVRQKTIGEKHKKRVEINSYNTDQQKKKKRSDQMAIRTFRAAPNITS